MPGDMTRDKQSTVFGQHPYGVSGVVGRRAQVNPPLCFRLGLVFPLQLAVTRLEEILKQYRVMFTVPHLVRLLVCGVSGRCRAVMINARPVRRFSPERFSCRTF